MKTTHTEPSFEDRTEDIWVLVRVGDGYSVDSAYSTAEAAEFAAARGDQPWGVEEVRIPLHRPSLRPIYGGPTLLEALWNEMDVLMERLMTGEAAEDGGDRYRAEELAWVLAIVENAYNPDMDRIRAKAMERWESGAK